LRHLYKVIHKIDEKDEYFSHCLKDIRFKLSNMGTIADSNEAIRCEYISAILHACVHITKKLTGKYISVNPRFEVVGSENMGCVDYRALEKLICITEGKQYQIDIGFAQVSMTKHFAPVMYVSILSLILLTDFCPQNIIQCESAFQTNKRKRKADDTFREDLYDYLFGIVTTAKEWYFLLYTSNGIFCTSRNPLNIQFVESALKEGSKEEKVLHESVKQVMEVIVGMLRDKVDVEKKPVMKRQPFQSYFEE
jgi:hypothetical protein